MQRDRRGRLRRPNQERGLRPLHPALPAEWSSRAIRVAMSRDDWTRFDMLVRSVGPLERTQPRALGVVISTLLSQSTAAAPPAPGPLDWMDWERQKTLRLLNRAV